MHKGYVSHRIPRAREMSENKNKEFSRWVTCGSRLIESGISVKKELLAKGGFIVDKPAVWLGLIPMPSSVMMAEVAGGTLNSSAANLSTAVKGVTSGTLSLQRVAKIHVISIVL